MARQDNLREKVTWSRGMRKDIPASEKCRAVENFTILDGHISSPNDNIVLITINLDYLKCYI